MNLRRKAAAGIIWVGISSFSVQLFGLLTSIWLARLLDPRDFGLITLAMVVISLSKIFSSLGFGGTIVQFPNLERKLSDTAFILNFGLSILLGTVVFLGASFFANLLGQRQIAPILEVLSLCIVFASIGVVPSNLLERELEFRKKLLAEVTPPLFYAIVAIFGALNGWGVWSLAAGTVVSTIAQTILFWAISDYRPSWTFDWAAAKAMWRFGQHLVYASLLLFLAANLDQVYIGKFIDVRQVGFYGLALSLGNLSTDYVASLFGRVLFPAFSRIQNDPGRLEEAYRTSIRYISYLAIPLCFGIFAVAPHAVHVIYGDKWAQSIPLIQILCFYGLFRSLGSLAGPFFSSVGKPSVTVKIIILRLVVLLLLIFPLGSRWNASGVAIALTLSMALSLVWSLSIVNRFLNIAAGPFLVELLPQFISALLMGAGVIYLSRFLPVSIYALLLVIFSGIILYALLLLLTGGGKLRKDVAEIYALLFKPESAQELALASQEKDRV